MKVRIRTDRTAAGAQRRRLFIDTGHVDILVGDWDEALELAGKLTTKAVRLMQAERSGEATDDEA